MRAAAAVVPARRRAFAALRDAPGPASAIVDAATVAFWNRYLKHDTAAEQQLVDAVESTGGKATLQRDLRTR